MLMNNLDPDVAENPNELVVYGGIGRAARDLERLRPHRRLAEALGEDETLLVQSGKPVGVFRTHADAPRVLIANSNLVPHWADWAHFNELDRKGLMMYGQMTAGSWIYIGTQGIVQGTYETFVEAGRQHYGGDLKGKWILTAGLGGMGGAQPLAAVMAGACCLAVECDPDRIDFRLRTRYVDERAETLDEALAMIERWTKAGEGEVGRPARQCRRDRAGAVPARRPSRHPHRPDLGARSAQRLSAEGLVAWRMAREADERSEGGREGGARVDARACRGDGRLLECRRADARLRQQHPPGGQGRGLRRTPSPFPGFVPAYIRPLFCRGIGPFRWAALSGDPEDIYRTDAKVKELTPGNTHLHNWLDMARRAHQVPGPAGAHLLGRPRRPAPARPRLQRDGGQRAS